LTAEPELAALSYPELTGEMGPRYYGRALTAFFGLSGVLFVTRGARALARLVFVLRAPTRVRLRDRGLELSSQTLLLGRVTRERELFVPFRSLLSIEREVRYANLGFYAGLLALVVGTYFGALLAVDGVRAGASWDILGWASALLIAGLAIDFIASTAFDSAKGRCRLLITVRDGKKLSVGSLDPVLVDDLLSRIKQAVDSDDAA
jgi:hypothetical protein